MYSLDRTKKMKAFIIALCVLAFALSFFGYIKGGYELLKYGFMNEAYYSIMMIACFTSGVVLLVLSLLINAVQKDIYEHLKYLDEKNSKQ